jgi:hypothetical protein
MASFNFLNVRKNMEPDQIFLTEQQCSQDFWPRGAQKNQGGGHFEQDEN